MAPPMVPRKVLVATGIAAAMCLVAIALVGHRNGKAALLQRNNRMQKLWGWNMGYEHHEMPPIYFGGSAARRATQTAALAPSAARQMQLWGWNMGYEHHEQLPPSTFGDKKQSPGDAQKLWMFNMGYEPLATGLDLASHVDELEGSCKVPSGTFLIDLSPRQHHEQLPPSTFGAKKQSPDDAQKLWMFNMGYEHHEQLPPSTFGDKKQSPGNAQQLWMFNQQYLHHEQPPFQFFSARK